MKTGQSARAVYKVSKNKVYTCPVFACKSILRECNEREISKHKYKNGIKEIIKKSNIKRLSIEKMNLEKMYREEDLFPKEITFFEKRDYGLLFYNEENKASFDSNHALIYKDKISDLEEVLADIVSFYKGKGIRPVIYQSILEEGYFEERKDAISSYGFDIFSESQKYMVLAEENVILPNAEVSVCQVHKWNEAYGKEIFEKAGEPWEIDVAKRALENKNTLFFVAFYKERPVGMLYAHVTDEVCRGDYLLVSKECRNIGVGRTLMHSFTEYCKTNRIGICYLWPAGDSAEKIYLEAGFREVETREAGRAVYKRE